MLKLQLWSHKESHKDMFVEKVRQIENMNETARKIVKKKFIKIFLMMMAVTALASSSIVYSTNIDPIFIHIVNIFIILSSGAIYAGAYNDYIRPYLEKKYKKQMGYNTIVVELDQLLLEKPQNIVQLVNDISATKRWEDFDALEFKTDSSKFKEALLLGEHNNALLALIKLIENYGYEFKRLYTNYKHVGGGVINP